MNEASVSSPFMKELRKRLVPSEVIKHHDASMIGLCDCSVTYNSHVWWLEFKFFPMKKKWARWGDDTAIVYSLMDDILKKAPAQNELLRRMNICAAGAFYIIWVKKTCIFVVYPDGELLAKFLTTGQLVDWFASRMQHYPA